jgi:hypothetical protein
MNSKSINEHLKIEIRESITTPLVIVGIIVYFIGYGLYEMTDQATAIGLPVFVLIMASVGGLLFHYILTLGKQAVIMSLTHEGIYLANSRRIRWDDILSIKIRKDRSGDGARFLVLQTVHAPKPREINITNIAISEKELTKHIQKFRHYYISEVEDD